MGYSSSAEGCIGITPPLTAKEMREHPDIIYSERKAMDEGKDAYVEVSKHSTDTDEGAVIVLTGAGSRTKRRGLTVTGKGAVFAGWSPRMVSDSLLSLTR